MSKYFRYKIIILFICISVASAAQNPYNFSIDKIEGGILNMSSLQGKKILLTVFDPVNPDMEFLTRLDSFYLQNTSRLTVIAIPFTDFGDGMPDSSLISLFHNQVQLSIIISKKIKAGRNNGAGHHPIARWLTNVGENGHFNNDITEPGQMFFLNENGNLFGTLRRSTPMLILTKALDRE